MQDRHPDLFSREKYHNHWTLEYLGKQRLKNRKWYSSTKDTDRPQIIVIARENTTGWVEAKASRSTMASEVAKFFYEDIISRYGTMICVTTDGGSEFKGDFHKLLHMFQVKHIVASSYNPAANGVVERGNWPYKKTIFKRCSNRQANRWPDYLPYALWAD